MLVVIVMTLGMAAVPIAGMGILGSVVARVAKRFRPRPGPRPRGPMTRRLVVEAVGGVAMIGATGSTLGWGTAFGRHEYELVELPVRIAALPRALDGYVIAQVSDLHAGTYVGERELDQGFERVRAAKPDLVVVTGDLVDFDPAYVPLVARKLADLAPRDGVFAILGNHDYYAGGDRVVARPRAPPGVRPLVNEGDRRAAPRRRRVFALPRRRRHPVVRALRPPRAAPRRGPSGDGARVGPARAPVAPAGDRRPVARQGRPLQLSGHTHGGQINPGFRPADLFMS